jgi:hypothetical protein
MANRSCFLKGHGACRGRISAEHYFSEAVLREIGDGKSLNMGGLKWQPKGTFQSIGIGSLTSRVLCEKHNAGLSPLDQVAANLVRTFNAIDKRPSDLPPLISFSGPDIERWFLKVLCGLAAANQLNASTIPDAWKTLLVGGAWAPGTGLFIATEHGPHILAKEVFLETKIDRTTGTIALVQFRLINVMFYLVLRPVDRPKSLGMHRPRGIIFQLDDIEKRVEFLWKTPTNDCVTYTRQGTTKEDPAHWAEWTKGSA